MSAPIVNIWTPHVNPRRGTLGRLFGVAREAVADSLQPPGRPRISKSLRGWLQHSLFGSVQGTCRVISGIQSTFGISFGHASIQLDEDFIGFWPPFREGHKNTSAERLLVEQLSADAEALLNAPRHTAEQDHLLKSFDEAIAEAAGLTPYEQELFVMGREPEHRIELPGLDQQAMSAHYRSVSLATEFSNRSYNCCTVCKETVAQGLESMYRQKSFFGRMSHQFQGTVRAVLNPMATATGMAAQAGCHLLAWNPLDLQGYLKAVREIDLGL